MFLSSSSLWGLAFDLGVITVTKVCKRMSMLSNLKRKWFWLIERRVYLTNFDIEEFVLVHNGRCSGITELNEMASLVAYIPTKTSKEYRTIISANTFYFFL